MSYQRIVVFGAHPDDELAMAPAIAKLADGGAEVFVVTMTNGSEGYPQPQWRDTIVATRRAEAAAADEVLGVTRRYLLDRDDMALADDKATLKECIRILRETRPQAVFTHGPHDRHRDHLATHTISVQAVWHAGEPVSAELGEPWSAPHLYYYKSCRLDLPSVVLDVTGYDHKLLEATATQVSQHTLFGRTQEDLLAEAERMRQARAPAEARFWLAPTMELPDFPPAAAE